MGDHKKQVVKPPSGSTIQETPIWRFDKLDRDGKFAFDLSRSDFKHMEVLQKLIEYGNMKWAEIDRQQHDQFGKKKHHYLSLGSLSSEAAARIRAKQLEEDTELIFSFALQNRLRIIGIREKAEFHIVWYDPNHEFCPSTRR